METLKMKNNSTLKTSLIVIFIISILNCKTVIKINKDIINTQTDYLPSLFHFEKGEIKKALAKTASRDDLFIK